MKSIKGKLFAVYSLILVSLSLTVFSSYIAIDTSNQHLMLSELLAEQRLNVELISVTTINSSTIRLTNETYYQDYHKETLDAVKLNKVAVDKVLRAFIMREFYVKDELKVLKFGGDFESLFIKVVQEAEKKWSDAYNDIEYLLDPNQQIDLDYSTARAEFISVNHVLIDDVELITKLCRDEADRQRKVSSLLQFSTLGITVVIFVWLIYFIKKSIQDPIISIRDVFSRMGSGDFSVSLEREADDEFKLLFEDFNRFIENKHAIDHIEDHILSEDNLRVVLQAMQKEFNEFVELEKIAIIYTDSFENNIMIESDELMATTVSSVPVYDSIFCEDPTTLIMPIHVNQVYLGYAKFYKRTAYSDRDIKFVSGLESKISFGFYKSLIFKDLLSIVTSALADLTESRDPETKKHLTRMSMYSQVIAKRLHTKGIYDDIIDEEFIDNILLAAPMHDIGKVAVPDHILLKPGKLTEEEFNQMKQHTCEGARVLKLINQRFSKYNIDYFKMAEEIAHFHQEKFNGSGYPEAVSGMDIPLVARICAVADVFDALTSKRPYKEAFSLEKSYSIIKSTTGQHFDPDMVAAFFESQEDIEKIYYRHREV
jgi:HD-GYP domain-containing protein (c-di-GMP phosphodiesterase class II)